MQILPLHHKITAYLQKHRLAEKFQKQKNLFLQNIRHPSLNTKVLEPKHLKIYSFRLDRKHRTIFIFHDQETVEILDVNNHYQ